MERLFGNQRGIGLFPVPFDEGPVGDVEPRDVHRHFHRGGFPVEVCGAVLDQAVALEVQL